MAKPSHPAADYELEAVNILATFMREGSKLHRLLAAAALVIAATLKNGKNGNGHAKT